MGTLHKLRSDFEGKAIVIAIYITEAHARDEWPIGSTISFCDQPTTLEERCTLAQHFIKEFNYQIPMLVDPIDNPFESKFAAWPFRFYIIENGILRMRAEPQKNSFVYELKHIREYLQKK